jgi:hypothetical protein
VNIALLLLAIPICVADLNALVIPNIYTKILFYLAVLHFSLFGFGQFQEALISVAVVMCLALLGTGMGDIKLLALILMTHTYPAIEFIGVILLFAAVHIVVLIGVHRKIPAKIPLAPSIFIGLATYLATR